MILSLSLLSVLLKLKLTPLQPNKGDMEITLVVNRSK